MDKSNEDGVSIDIEKLENSLKRQLESLCSLTDDCCIYRVPPKIRMLDASFYTPKIVSIGPLHYGRSELKAMEEHKLRYLQQFLGQTSAGMKDFLLLIEAKEVELRNCYAETLPLKSEEFVKMILLDAVFFIEILLRYEPEFCCVDRIFTSPGMIKDIVLDIMLLENQLPIFILQDLFSLANLEMALGRERYSLSQLTRFFFEYYICPDILIDNAMLESRFSEARHFVDLLRLCMKPPECYNTERDNNFEDAPTVTTLHQAGIKFELASTKNLFDITFEKGTLKIPKLTVGNMTVHLLRNLQIYESLHCDTNYMNDYNVILSRLLSTPKDVQLLIENGVFENRVLDSERVLTVFRQLSRDVGLQYNKFYYSGLVKDLKRYCKYILIDDAVLELQFSDMDSPGYGYPFRYR